MTPFTIEQFENHVRTFDWKGAITHFHVHHTADPIATWRGEASVEAIRRYHMNIRKYRDFAQHVTLGPDGSIWLGRDWNLAPASATGHNGYDYQHRPFMVEVFADFRTDKLEGAQHDNLVRMIAAIQERFDLPPDAIRFHREMQPTECPGALDKAALVNAVKEQRDIGAA